jgi:hypothetical protein
MRFRQSGSDGEVAYFGGWNGVTARQTDISCMSLFDSRVTLFYSTMSMPRLTHESFLLSDDSFGLAGEASHPHA